MRSGDEALCARSGSALASASESAAISAALGEHDDAGRLRAEEHARVVRVTGDLDHLEARVVQHLAQLVEAVDADRVVALAGAAVLEHHGALDAQAAGEEVDVHLIHADAPVSLEPDQARLARADVVPVDDVEQEH